MVFPHAHYGGAVEVRWRSGPAPRRTGTACSQGAGGAAARTKSTRVQSWTRLAAGGRSAKAIPAGAGGPEAKAVCARERPTGFGPGHCHPKESVNGASDGKPDLAISLRLRPGQNPERFRIARGGSEPS